MCFKALVTVEFMTSLLKETGYGYCCAENLSWFENRERNAL